MKRQILIAGVTALLLGNLPSNISAQSFTMPEGKEIYIPSDLKDNDFTSKDSKWSYHRMATSPNFVVFWEKGFGDDLSKAPDLEGHNMKVNLDKLISKLESFYAFYKDSMKFVLPGSKSEKYRMMAMLNYSLEGTAYGGDYDQTIGALWISPNRIQDERLNCIAHEIGHSFQSQVGSDGQGESWGGGGIFEMTSQWMLWNVNPHWIDDETFHWKGFIDQMHLPFLAPENIYHSPFLLEYWSMKHGLTVMADLFRAGKKGEDPAMTYMRMFNLSNQQFAEEALDCYSRLITFDFPRVKEACKPYINQFVCKEAKVPQTFGTNVIPLTLKPKISVKFTGKGNKANDGYAYRIVCTDDNGNAYYSDIKTAYASTISMKAPSSATHAYLVVVGYPKDEYKPVKFNFWDEDAPKEEPRKFDYVIKQK